MSLVNVSIVGNIVKQPEQTVFNGGRTKTTLIMGVKAPTKLKEDNMDFYKVEAWGKLGDIAHKYVAKGNQVGVCGRLIVDRWQGKDGKERTTLVIRAEQLSLPPLPPKLRVVDNDEPAQPMPVTNPISGELTDAGSAAFPATFPAADPDEEFDELEAAACAVKVAGG